MRLAGPDGDARTDALIEAANATGRVLFTRTVLDGRVALRFSIGATATQWGHVEAAWQLLQTLAGAPAVARPGTPVRDRAPSARASGPVNRAQAAAAARCGSAGRRA